MDTTKTRNIKELLQLMLDNKQLFKNGLCIWVDKLYGYDLIHKYELDSLSKYIKDNKPSINEWSISMLLYSPGKFSHYYWAVDKIYPRVQWLKKHIKKNS